MVGKPDREAVAGIALVWPLLLEFGSSVDITTNGCSGVDFLCIVRLCFLVCDTSGTPERGWLSTYAFFSFFSFLDLCLKASAPRVALLFVVAFACRAEKHTRASDAVLSRALDHSG